MSSELPGVVVIKGTRSFVLPVELSFFIFVISLFIQLSYLHWISGPWDILSGVYFCVSWICCKSFSGYFVGC